MKLREVAVVGIGGTKFGRQTDRSIRDIAVEACLKAIKDANVHPKEIQVACAGNCAQWEWGQGLFITQIALRELGITQVPMLRVENGCATGSTGRAAPRDDASYHAAARDGAHNNTLTACHGSDPRVAAACGFRRAREHHRLVD